MTVKPYTTVLHYAEYRYEDRKSEFIGESMPVSTEAEALAFIESIKKRFPDATHHVYAYVLRENNTSRFTDDREPQGTAGMPVLDSIRKRGIVDVVVVVTRYFGGTLLGTGGLVRAYTSAAVGAIESSQVVRYDIYSNVKLTVGYQDHGRLSVVLDKFKFRTENTLFSDKVEIFGSLLSSDVVEFEKNLMEITSGRIIFDKIREKFSI